MCFWRTPAARQLRTGERAAKQRNGAATRPGTMRSLRFDGSRSTTLAPGQAAVSDATTLVTAPLEHLAVTLYIDRPSGAATFHQLGLTTTYRTAGSPDLCDDCLPGTTYFTPL